MFRRTQIGSDERGLRFRHGEFVEMLGPGTYGGLLERLKTGRSEIYVVSAAEPRFEHKQLDTLIRCPEFREAMTIVAVAYHQRGLVFQDGGLLYVLGAGTHALFKEPRPVDVVLASTLAPKFEHAQLATLVCHPEFREAMTIVEIADFQRGLVFRDGGLLHVLSPGTHAFLKEPCPVEVTIISALQTKFEHPLLDVLLQHAEFRELVTIVDVADRQRALVKKDGRIAYLLGPGRHAFFKQPYALDVEVFDVGTLRFEHQQLDAILALPNASQMLQVVNVGAHEEVLLLKDGELVERLSPGRHVFLIPPGRLEKKAIDRREQVLDVAGQEIMTRDPVTLRLNLIITFQVVDPVKAITVVSDHAQALYRDAQLALRAAIGTRTLDALLADKDSVGREVHDEIAARAAHFGLAVRKVGLKDIILPGEMRTILNQVVEAEKAAQANLIKRREETAAARSQANTAKLLAESPVLARMKELELIQEILKGTQLSVALGQGDVSEQLRRLFHEEPRAAKP